MFLCYRIFKCVLIQVLWHFVHDFQLVHWDPHYEWRRMSLLRPGVVKQLTHSLTHSPTLWILSLLNLKTSANDNCFKDQQLNKDCSIFASPSVANYILLTIKRMDGHKINKDVPNLWIWNAQFEFSWKFWNLQWYGHPVFIDHLYGDTIPDSLKYMMWWHLWRNHLTYLCYSHFTKVKLITDKFYHLCRPYSFFC